MKKEIIISIDDKGIINIVNNGFDKLSFIGLCEYLRVININNLSDVNKDNNK